MLASSLSAASTMASFGFTGGYSDTAEGYGLIGFNTTAQYLGDISNRIGIGIGTHLDLDFGIAKEKWGIPFLFALIAGPGMEFRLTPSQTINLTIGPGIVLEAGRGFDSFALGLGIDALYTFYFDQDRTLGFSVGGTFYPEFLIDDETRPGAGFGFAATGYIGITWRERGYAVDPIDLDPLGYTILREGL